MAEAGKVKFWNAVKGYGFLTRDTGPDVFIHKVDLRATGIETLVDGQPVQFDVVPGREGKPKATNVRIGIP
jgi:CspA family cold shock protein